MFQCTSAGYHPDPSDCRSYFYCDKHLHAYHSSCALNEYFDPENMCVSGPCPHSATKSKTRVTTTEFKCEELGIFEDENDCTSYHVCLSNRTAERHTCLQGHFDASSRQCSEGLGPCGKASKIGAETEISTPTTAEASTSAATEMSTSTSATTEISTSAMVNSTAAKTEESTSKSTATTASATATAKAAAPTSTTPVLTSTSATTPALTSAPETTPALTSTSATTITPTTGTSPELDVTAGNGQPQLIPADTSTSPPQTVQTKTPNRVTRTTTINQSTKIPNTTNAPQGLQSTITPCKKHQTTPNTPVPSGFPAPAILTVTGMSENIPGSNPAPTSRNACVHNTKTTSERLETQKSTILTLPATSKASDPVTTMSPCKTQRRKRCHNPPARPLSKISKPTLPEERFKCPGRGKYPNPRDRRSYFVCGDTMTPLRKECLFFYVYDPVKRSCTFRLC